MVIDCGNCITDRGNCITHRDNAVTGRDVGDLIANSRGFVSISRGNLLKIIDAVSGILGVVCFKF